MSIVIFDLVLSLQVPANERVERHNSKPDRVLVKQPEFLSLVTAPRVRAIP